MVIYHSLFLALRKLRKGLKRDAYRALASNVFSHYSH